MSTPVPPTIPSPTPSGGERLVSQLVLEGVSHVFTVPGESFIAALDAMHDDMTVHPVTCRNEAGAAMMAEATGKLTGRPGIALVTRGPGAANAVPGVYIAHHDASPMILLVGLPPTAKRGRPAFQDVNLSALFGSISKWCAVIPSADEIETYLKRAFRTALWDRRGPVVLGLPEEILNARSETKLSETQNPAPQPTVAVPLRPTPDKLAHIRIALAHAERPLVIVGGSEWSADASQKLQLFAERFDIPVATSFRRQDHFDNRHQCYVGHLGFAPGATLSSAVQSSDCILALGTSLGDVTTNGYSLIDPETIDRRLIRIAADAGNPDSVFAKSLTVAASPILIAEALANLDPPRTLPMSKSPWSTWRRDLRLAYESTLKPTTEPHHLQLDEIILSLSRHVPNDTIICNGAGNYAAFLHRHFQYKTYPSQLAPTTGSMGYGLPAAIAAKLAEPSRPAIAIAGDGCFQMTAQELATAVQMDLDLIVIVCNNASLGTIRQHQEQRFPGRIVATTLSNPNFVELAKSYGAAAECITSNAMFEAALLRALKNQGVTLIELKLDIDQIAPGISLKSQRASDLET